MNRQSILSCRDNASWFFTGVVERVALQEVCSTSHVALTSCEDAAQACKLRMDMLQSFPGFALPSSDFETNINDMVLQASQLMQQITADSKQHVAFKREKVINMHPVK